MRTFKIISAVLTGAALLTGCATNDRPPGGDPQQSETLTRVNLTNAWKAGAAGRPNRGQLARHLQTTPNSTPWSPRPWRIIRIFA